MASRAQMVDEVIRPALEAGRVVVCDRFLLATIVYQGLAGGLDAAEVASVGRSATGGLLPDLTIVLDVPPEIARRSGRRPRGTGSRTGRRTITSGCGAVMPRPRGRRRSYPAPIGPWWTPRPAPTPSSTRSEARWSVSWHSIRGHDRVVDELASQPGARPVPACTAVRRSRGGRQADLRAKLAQALLCETRPAERLDPCEACPGCLQVEAGTHPDLEEFGRPEDKHELPIAVIRDLCEHFALKPARSQRKVAILDDADDLNEEAANAFLKTLEEPPPGAVLILIGTSVEVQLPTIVSRCQVVRFDPLPATDLAALLQEQGVARDEADAARLAALGDGSIRKALGLADPGLERFRRALIDELASEHGVNPSALAASGVRPRQAGGEGVGGPSASGDLARRRAGPVLPRRPLADRRPRTPLPRSRRPTRRRLRRLPARTRGRLHPRGPLPRSRLQHPAPPRHEPDHRGPGCRSGKGAERPGLRAHALGMSLSDHVVTPHVEGDHNVSRE